ncbi:ISL3 family transposase [Nesterenkonia sp. DZ6]|uniref:ISL3 family transposase n=1 Tax=Nesterenkonia sp. DZ6 TaxID=2901229 RepID=UPI001F4CA0C2|nr:ISL3 family transposase [Nesterenkonia sp. DZ6]MCH8559402.1 ISL3 family transposase [Nesterenkonia sp. DZ6]
MSQPTREHLTPRIRPAAEDPARDAASVVFNLAGYTVLEAVDLPLGGRRVVVTAQDQEEACPECGVLATRVRHRIRQRVKDVPLGGGRAEVVVAKPRLICAETACPGQTFTQVTEQMPSRARCTTRLREAVVAAVLDSGRATAEVAHAHGIAWATVNTAILTQSMVLPQVDQVPVRALGIDEHRFATANWFKHPQTSVWCRVEPWMSTFVDANTGHVLGIVDGRSSKNVAAWLQARSPGWLDRLEVVAIDPSMAFRSAIRTVLPAVQISVDRFHLVKLGNQMFTQVRQRALREVLGRRGRKQDAVWAHRMLLLRAGDRFTAAGLHRLEQVLDDADFEQVAAAWALKEHLRRILNAESIPAAQRARIDFELAVAAAGLPEAEKLSVTVARWWPEIKMFTRTRVTNARSEAANTSIKQIKRTGLGFRNQANYQSRILARSFRQTRRRSRIHSRAGLHAQV